MNIKKVAVPAIASLLVAVLIGGFVLFHIGIPVIKASNIERFNNKISSNAPITITFSQIMNRSSVEEGFIISPETKGHFKWFLNEVSFIPDEDLIVSETYTVTVPGSVKNILGRALGEDKVITFMVMDPPKVSLAVPNDETEADSRITVMFDRPMVEFTTYDTAEKGKFPLEIAPAIKGHFKWIGTSAFQYIPDDRLAFSTTYTGIIPVNTKSLDGGSLRETYTFTFSTPQIKRKGELASQISASDPYIIRFNQDVNLGSLLEHVEVKNKAGDKVELNAKYGKRTEVTFKDGQKVEKEVIDKTRALLLPKRDDWGYDNSYVLAMTKGVMGNEGNLSASSEISEAKFTTKTFLANRYPAKDDTGINPFVGIDLDFDQEVDVGSVLSHFKSEPQVEFSAAYDKKCDPKWEPESPDEECQKIDDRKSVVLTPKEKLKNLASYKVTLNKEMRASNGIAYLKDDEVWSFAVSDVFRVLRSTPAAGDEGSYKHVCLFTSTLANAKDLEKQIEFAPANKGKISVNAYELDGKGGQGGGYYGDDYGDDSYSACAGKKGKEKFVLDINALLMPATKHKMLLKGVAKDTFGQALGADFSLDFQTEDLKDRDTNLKILQNGLYATSTLDQHANPVFAAQNLNNFDLEICRVSAEKFMEVDTEYARDENRDRSYSQYGWPVFTPSEENCAQYKKINKKLDGKYWDTEYVELELAKELGAPLLPGYYYLRASSPRVYRTENIYSYSPEKQRDVVTGTRRIPIRPDQVLNITNLHLAVKQSSKTALFWATALDNGQPVSEVEVKLFTEKGVEISGSSITDKSGIAKRELNDLPFQFAVARLGNDTIVVNQDWQKGIAPWDYSQMNYSQSERYTQGYIYTDRPLYQPTHEVFFKGILREDNDAFLSMPKYTSIEVKVTDSRGVSIYNKDLKITPQGTFTDSLKLDESAPLGRYEIEGCLGSRDDNGDCGGHGSIFSQLFHVEKYRKPEYKLDVSFNKEGYVNGDEMRALVDGQYFFGAPVSNGKVNWTLRAQNYYFDEYKDEWFSFTDYDTYRKCYFGCPYGDQFLADGSGNLDEQGKFLVTRKLDLSSKDENGKVKPPDSSKIYTLEATIQDSNNQSVSGRKEVVINRGAFYVGVKNEKYIVGVNESMPIKTIAVDPKGRPLGGVSIKLELMKINWKYVKKRQIDGGFYWDNEMDPKLVDSDNMTTGGDGKAAASFKMKDGGEYFVKASSQDSLGNTFGSTVDFYVTTQETVSWKQENNNRMELKLDKVSYEIGDKAQVLVKSPYKNVKALLTYERGDISEAKVVNIDSNAQVIEVPITEKMAPNFYVSVLEVKGGNRQDPPDFKLGYANVVVDIKNKELVISIKPDKKFYEPRERVNLEITTTDKTGRPVAADLSIAVVDASLLALKGNPERDLVNLFYNRRSLGVMTSDNLTNLLERINVSDLKGSKGGSGKGADEFGKPRGDFEDTAYFRSSLATGADGKLTTSFDLPDNLTTWNIEAVGATQNSLFGSVNETVTTQKAVMLRPVLPRFVLFQDELKVGAIVHNFTEQAGVFTVKVADLKNLAVDGDSKQKVKIAPQDSAKVLFPILVPKVKNGTMAEITMSVEGNGKGDSVKQSFPIYSYSTPETVALSSFTDDISYTEKILLPNSIDSELGELKITTGATLATYISDSLNYLLDYPYGCTEQIVSQLLPNVLVKNVASLPNLQDKLKLQPIVDDKGKVITFDVMVQKNLQKIYDLERPEGGWGYFAGSHESYPYLSSYTLFGLYHLKKTGYAVDENVIAHGTSYLQDYMRTNKDLMDPYTRKLAKKTSGWANTRAYMLFVMAEIGRGDTGLTNSLYDDKDLLSNSGKAYLAMTIHTLNPGDSRKTAELLKNLGNQARIDARGTYIRNDSGSSFDMMTNAKTTAIVLQTMNRINPKSPLIPKLVSWLVKIRKDGRWETTQDNVAALIALTEYLEINKETQANYGAKVVLGEKVINEYSVNSSSVLDQQEVTRSLTELERGGSGTKVVFYKDGQGRLYYDMVLKYFLPIDEILPRGEGFNIERNYYSASDTKMEHPVTSAKAGETLHGHLTIVVPEERHAVSVENFLPAGFELVNFAFETSKQSLSAGDEQPMEYEYYGEGEYSGRLSSDGYFRGSDFWDHKEFRDDRLFLFADKLSKGVYEYDYYVQVTSEGKFHHPPAVISEMYFPENFGRTKGEWIEVKGE